MRAYLQGKNEALTKLGLADTAAKKLNSPKFLEGLASIEHDQWKAWATSLAKSENLSPERLKRWETSMKDYAKLTDKNKEADRKWARKVRALIRKTVK